MKSITNLCVGREQKIMYLILLKALYGCVKSALLWYGLFTTTLKYLTFKLNHYDKCVANNIINGKQCTIAWHVDDNNISHVASKVVTEVINSIDNHIFLACIFNSGMMIRLQY